MQEVSAILQAYMKANRLNQSGLAKRAKVSQASVCRALKGVPLRRGAAREQLFKLVGIEDPRSTAAERVVAAFERIWDNSDEHVEAVVGVIDALGGFTSNR